MELNNLIGRVLRAQTIRLTTTGLWKAEITIELPDLREAPRTIRSDGRPMYRVSIPRNRPIRLHQRTSDPMDRTTGGVLSLETLCVEWPAGASVREQTPLVMKLPLHHRNVEIQLYYDAQGQIARAELALLRIRGRIPILVNIPSAIERRVA